MATGKQVEANKRNAKHGTGPRTADGKARVGHNALKHGLTAELMVVPGESFEEFNAFRGALLDSLDLHGQLEAALGEKIVADLWRQRRVPVIEAAIYKRYRLERITSLSSREEFEDRPCSARDLAQALGMLGSEADKASVTNRGDREEDAWIVLRNEPLVELTMAFEDYHKIFKNIWRHEASLSRSVSKNFHELQRLQAMKAGERIAPPAVVDLDINVSHNRSANPEAVLQNELPVRISRDRARDSAG